MGGTFNSPQVYININTFPLVKLIRLLKIVPYLCYWFCFEAPLLTLV